MITVYKVLVKIIHGNDLDLSLRSATFGAFETKNWSEPTRIIMKTSCNY